MLELCSNEMKTVGTWRYGFGSWTDRFKIEREAPPVIEEKDPDKPLKGKFLKVLTLLVNTNNVEFMLSSQ